MPEGHSIRYFADAHEHCFQGLPVEASSPQGRFTEGAAAINGRTLLGTTTHGKHLFLHFAEVDEIVHIHLGLYGWFKAVSKEYRKSDDVDLSPKPSTRLRLENPYYISDLIGPTKCEYITTEQLQAICSRLGPDPLHEEADPEPFYKKVLSSKKTIGQLLMDQSVIAGIGNVYRAELLFLTQQNPMTPGSQVNEQTLIKIWNAAAVLMQDGSTDGMIRTVPRYNLTEEEKQRGRYTQYSNVYKRHTNPCRVCGTSVSIADLAGRKLYWCTECQK